MSSSSDLSVSDGSASEYGDEDDTGDDDDYDYVEEDDTGDDDDYDYVVAQVGADNADWDIKHDESLWREEAHLFWFNPFQTYFGFDIRDLTIEVTMTYQHLIQLAEMTLQLLTTWKKRSAAASQEDDKSKGPLHQGKVLVVGRDVDLAIALFNKGPKEQIKLRNYAVGCFFGLFGLGSDDTCLSLQEEVGEIVKFCKKCLLEILGECLPPNLPYLVQRSIFSHLQVNKGLYKLGEVAKQETSLIVERKHMEWLYGSLAYVYEFLKQAMFNSFILSYSDVSLSEHIRSGLSESFKVLAEFVDSSRLENGLETDSDDAIPGEGSAMEGIENSVEGNHTGPMLSIDSQLEVKLDHSGEVNMYEVKTCSELDD